MFFRSTPTCIKLNRKWEFFLPNWSWAQQPLSSWSTLLYPLLPNKVAATPAFNIFWYDAAGVRTDDLPVVRRTLYWLSQHTGTSLLSSSLDQIFRLQESIPIFIDHYFSLLQNLNPYCMGGGGLGGPPPPSTFLEIAPQPLGILNCRFMTFFPQVLRTFWYHFRRNRIYL